MQIKSTISYHFTSVTVAIIKMSTNNKCLRGCGDKRNPCTLFIGMKIGAATMKNSTFKMGEGEREMFQENSIETCILSRVKQITSPGWMHETSARAWYTGKAQRDRAEREVGGGIGMGNTCKSMADSCQCMTKNTTIL